MSHWEKQVGSTLYYCTINPNEVVVGQNSGSPHSDHAGSCTHQGFLDGEYQMIILKHLGESVLLDVLKALGGSQSDQKAYPKSVHKVDPPQLIIPMNEVSEKRKEWDKYGLTVRSGFQSIPHFDALAPTLENMKKCTPLTRALQTVSEYTLIQFLDQFDLNEVDGNGASPLNMAILHPIGERMMEYFIQAGVSVNTPDGNGVYPLEIAIACQQRHKFPLLKKAKVDVHQRFEGGRSYLHLAVERKSTLSLSPLKKLKIDLNAVDQQGQSALHYSVFNGVVDALIKLKVNPDLENSRGETALDLALRGALAHRVSLTVEGTYKGKEALYEINQGRMTMRVGTGKPRKLKLDVERSIARKISEDHLMFIRFIEGSVALCKTANLSLLTPSGESILQLIADLQRPEFDKVLKKRGIDLPPPQTNHRVYEKPSRPTYMVVL